MDRGIRGGRSGRTGALAGIMLALLALGATLAHAQAKGPGPGPGPTIVVETSRGTFEFETYPADAPKTVAHILALVEQRFYDGQRVHRALPGFLVQWGDPRSRDAGRDAEWGRGPAASSGHPIGVSEVSKKHLHVEGAVAAAHPGTPDAADSQMYVTLAPRPDLNGYYTIFGRVTSGAGVPAMLQRGDVIRRMYVRP